MAMKTALGCAAFGVGALIAVLLLLPTLCQGFVRSTAEKIFAQQFLGSLKIRDLSLSWRSPQKLTEAVVLDPEGREVVRATAELPSILDLLGSKSTRKVHLLVDADLVAD